MTSEAFVNVLFAGLVGSDKALGGLDVTTTLGTIQLNSASVNTASDSGAGTNGNQRYNGDVVLGNTTVGVGGSTLTATGAIIFLGKVDALVSGTQTLTADAAGYVEIDGNVGSTVKLGELTVTADNGIIIFQSAPITIDTLASVAAGTTGNQTYNGEVVLIQDATLTSGDGGDIIFASTIDAYQLGTQTLTVDAFDDVIFNGNIGTGAGGGGFIPTFALGELVVTAQTGTIQLNAHINR